MRRFPPTGSIDDSINATNVRIVEFPMTALGRFQTLLMLAMDTLNRRYGCGTVALASAGVAAAPRRWSMKQERRTPRYTTRWDELLTVRLVCNQDHWPLAG